MNFSLLRLLHIWWGVMLSKQIQISNQGLVAGGEGEMALRKFLEVSEIR